MKRCLVCQSTYTDNSLQYCLQDGGALVRVNDPEAATLAGRPDEIPTEVLPRPLSTGQQMARSTAPVNTPAPAVPGRPSPVTWIILALLLLAGLAGALTFAFREQIFGGPAVIATATPTPAPTPRPTPSKPPANKATPPSRPTPTPLPKRAAGEVDFTVTASSTRAPFEGIPYDAANIRDGLWDTAWIEGGPGPGIGASLTCNFKTAINLQQITITPGYFKSQSVWEKNNRLKKATLTFSDGASRQLDFADEMRYATLEVGPVTTKWVRLTIDEVYPGTTDADDTAISDISFTTAR